MESPRLRLLPLLGAALLLLLPLLGALAQEDAELQPRALDIYSAVEDASHEKELIEALQEVLKKLKSKRIPIYEKKYGQVPMVRLRGHPASCFSKMKYTNLSFTHSLLPRMWRIIHTMGLQNSVGSPLFPWLALAPWSLRLKTRLGCFGGWDRLRQESALGSV
uniref:CART prepropeptide n=1 Tax=Sus scrofa TaxID=9823 RepID=A0A8D1U9T2_PIG